MMPSKSKRPCSYPRCSNLAERTYCEQHSKVREDSKAETSKQYDKYQRDPKSTAFYKSKAWRDMRAYTFSKQHGLCQHCLIDNRFVRGDIVDHKLPIKANWSKRLQEDNLQVLCHKCHNNKTMRERKL
jgi:5-methylcytosine-specific restriction protein A